MRTLRGQRKNQDLGLKLRKISDFSAHNEYDDLDIDQL